MFPEEWKAKSFLEVGLDYQKKDSNLNNKFQNALQLMDFADHTNEPILLVIADYLIWFNYQNVSLKENPFLAHLFHTWSHTSCLGRQYLLANILSGRIKQSSSNLVSILTISPIELVYSTTKEDVLEENSIVDEGDLQQWLEQQELLPEKTSSNSTAAIWLTGTDRALTSNEVQSFLQSQPRFSDSDVPTVKQMETFILLNLSYASDIFSNLIYRSEPNSNQRFLKNLTSLSITVSNIEVLIQMLLHNSTLASSMTSSGSFMYELLSSFTSQISNCDLFEKERIAHIGSSFFLKALDVPVIKNILMFDLYFDLQSFCMTALPQSTALFQKLKAIK
ncbi:CCR4-Not complex subunit 11 [Schizosaccharomyces osmophilus]|uniref:CCR4-Not complex subunit 11 n=1 Tax=Schizosaccharomyces osmophilus TaxID=2545709 RepID=A0AAE9WDD7_9SCHI|nr:CCR4-Not complex subunit 11 [Schizosaccharomyces osmophilus]WBW72638.1 CCR4-Not complex subunit 11 [Schizosaccharomyces osmophilus]